MRELRDIISALAALQARKEQAALATVVRVRGSTYRREGARLLIHPDGRTTGSISGGCLEGDAAEVAREVIRTGQPRLVTYDLMSDDDTVWGLGLGCNGIIDVFIESVSAPSTSSRDTVDLVALFRDAVEHRRTATLATVVAAPPGGPVLGARLARSEQGDIRGSLGDAGLDARVTAAARAQAGTGEASIVPVEMATGRGEVFLEVIAPPPPLLVCGAGHDAMPLVRMAHELGWWVIVTDRRPAYATQERFPDADEVIVAEDQEIPQKVRVDRQTFAVVMTHNYLHDLAIFRGLLGTPARYIGLLGPRVRTDKLVAEVENDGARLGDAQRARVYGPVGLDVGAESPEEIALSILTEILAVKSGRPVASLRDRRGPIHTSVSS